MCERVRDINPNARVEIVDRFIDESNCAEFVGLCPDVIVDAIDSLAPKAALAAAALSEGVPIVSSMGAARKTDPLKVAAAELFKTHSCPMAARMRKELRARGFKKGQPCVFSTEIPEAASHVKSGAAGREKNNWEHAHCNGDVRACAGKPRPCANFKFKTLKMSIYERDYMNGNRRRAGSGFALSPVKIFILLNVACFLAEAFAERAYGSAAVSEWFALSPTALAHGRVWTLLTYSFLHADILHIFCNMLGLYFIGTFLEKAVGARKFAALYLTGALAGGALWAALAEIRGRPRLSWARARR